MRQWQAHDGWIWSIAFGPDSASILTAAHDDFIDVWDADGNRQHRIADLSEFPGAAFSPAGDLLAVAFRDRLRLLRTANFTVVDEYGISEVGGPISVSFSGDGQTVYAADRRGCWRVRLSGSPPFRWMTDGRYIDAWCHVGGRTLASIWRPFGGRVEICQAENGEIVEAFEGVEDTRQVQRTALTPDGVWLVTGQLSGKIAIWERRERRLAEVLTAHSPRGVLGLAVDATSRLLASGGSDGTVRLWEMPTGRELACFDCEVGPINRVAFAPDSLTLAASADRGTLIVLDVDG